MTELIEFCIRKQNVQHNKVNIKEQQQYDLQKFSSNQINRTIKKVIRQIDKNYIKIDQFHFFHLDYNKFKGQETYWNNQFTLYGFITVKNRIFTLKLNLVDSKGHKLSPKSSHHRTLLSNFILQINAQLQNFKFQYNPQLQEVSFVFNINCQSLDQTSVNDLLNFALQSYFEESQAHFYIISLIEIINLPQNQFLTNIYDDSLLLKKFLRERRVQAYQSKLYSNFLRQKDECVNHKKCKQSNDWNQKITMMKIKQTQKYLLFESKKLQIQREQNPNTLKQTYKKFKDYYKEESIFSKYLTSKNKYKNQIQINPRNASNLTDFLSTRLSLSMDQIESLYRLKAKNETKNNVYEQKENKINRSEKTIDQNQQISEKMRIWDKNSNKSFLIQMLFMRSDQAKKEDIILQKLCKVESFLFFNQYITIENFDFAQAGYIAVNASPNRILLSQFLKNSNLTISLTIRLSLCINLLQIFYTLIMKSKITNYFPQISIRNLEISKNLYLSFKFLSKISSSPLLQLINSINQIMFSIRICSEKQAKDKHKQIVKGDQAQNKYFGISIQINIIKYYLLELYQQGLYLGKLQQLKVSKGNKSQQSMKIDHEIKQTLIKSCQQLLVIFNHFKNSLSRGYEEDLNFSDQFSDDD